MWKAGRGDRHTFPDQGQELAGEFARFFAISDREYNHSDDCLPCQQS